MFTVHCDCVDGEMLLSESRITGMANTDVGIVVSYRCWCGRDGTFVTGRRAGRPAAERHDHAVHQLVS
ncbi:MAG: hypothetical protein S0880_09125 [Actinomycetota bacterium]|nr:hypothetical protein [Actinomycetota bacterium]